MKLNSEYKVIIPESTGKIVLDGRLDDDGWKNNNPVSDFKRLFPDDTSYAILQTAVYIQSDAKNLYIAAICHDTIRKPYVVESLKRDFIFANNDNFTVVIDPHDAAQNGYVFSVTPFGVQREGQVINGGNSAPNDIWDQKWQAAVKREKDYWIVEISIPFSILRLKNENDNWGINFVRNSVKTNEISSWAPVPISQPYTKLGFAGSLQWIKTPDFPRPNISFIPYSTFKLDKNHELAEPSEMKFNAGLDMKMPVLKSLNLDVTINPDFSQAEVDRQIVNLDRFDIFFPEQRQFFIENSDFFSYFGFTRIRPFFSRKIGLYNNRIIPIVAGARLSGQINRKWRTGIMMVQTKKTEDLASQNYFVTALQRFISNHSILGLIAVNRQGKDYDKIKGNDYNRVIGVEYNLRTPNGKWDAEAFLHYNFSAVNKNGSFAGALFGRRRTRKLTLETNMELVGEKYNPDIGYVPRKGINRLNSYLTYRMFPASKRINQHYIDVVSDIFHSFSSFVKLDELLTAKYSILFKNTSIIAVDGQRYFTRLVAPFDATGAGNTPLPVGEYRYARANIYFTSNYRKKIWVNLQAGAGNYFNGKRTQLIVQLNKRFLPYGSVSVNAEYNDITLNQSTVNAYLWLVGSRIDLTFSRSIFFTSFLQYNTQTKNFNNNTRFQWRYAPLSDLYIVYTENYFSADFKEKNRALIVKWTYWLNW